MAATIPAAVIAMALFRIPAFRGGILEQNITRTAASVGEALVAGAIFTIPAFMMVDIGGQRLWTDLRSHYWEATLILLVGGLIGVFFIILLRRPLCVDAPLPWPESVASYEIVKSGEASESKAPRYIFGALGFGGLIEILTDEKGAQIFREYIDGFLKFPRSAHPAFRSRKETHRRCHTLRRHPVVHAQPVTRADRHRLHHRSRTLVHQCFRRHHRLVDSDSAAAVLRSRSSAPHRDQ